MHTAVSDVMKIGFRLSCTSVNQGIIGVRAGITPVMPASTG